MNELAQQWREQDRQLALPTQLTLADQVEPLFCGEILRLLPGKRIVCRAIWNKTPVIAKLFFQARDYQDKAKQDKNGIRYLHDANIASAKILYFGSVADEKIAVVIYEELLETTSFQQIITDTPSPVKLAHHLTLLMPTLATMHQQGLWQQDIHFDNFLVQKNKIFVIDGYDVHKQSAVAEPLLLSQSLDNLALLFSQFPVSQQYVMMKPFIKYCEHRSINYNEALQQQLITLLEKHNQTRLKKYLKKIQRDCTEVSAQKSWHEYQLCKRDMVSTLNPLLTDPDYFIANPVKLLKSGRSSTVAVVEVNQQKFLVKRYNIKNILHVLSRCYRPSRAFSSWINSHILNFMGIDTPQPLAIIEKRFGPLRQKAYFICEYVEGVTAYAQLYDQPDTPENRALCQQFVQLMKQFSTHKICHGDLKAMNFILAQQKIYVLDLDSLRHNPKNFDSCFAADIHRFLANWQPPIVDIFKQLLQQENLLP